MIGGLKTRPTNTYTLNKKVTVTLKVTVTSLSTLFQILIHPPQNMIQPRNAPIGSPDAREPMRFFGEAHEFRLHASAFERHEGLLTLLNGAAMVMLVVDNECGRLGFAQIFYG